MRSVAKTFPRCYDVHHVDARQQRLQQVAKQQHTKYLQAAKQGALGTQVMLLPGTLRDYC